MPARYDPRQEHCVCRTNMTPGENEWIQFCSAGEACPYAHGPWEAGLWVPWAPCAVDRLKFCCPKPWFFFVASLKMFSIFICRHPTSFRATLCTLWVDVGAFPWTSDMLPCWALHWRMASRHLIYQNPFCTCILHIVYGNFYLRSRGSLASESSCSHTSGYLIIISGFFCILLKNWSAYDAPLMRIMRFCFCSGKECTRRMCFFAHS